MWPFSELQQLRGELQALRERCTRAESAAGTVRQLSRQVRVAEKRAHEAEQSLVIERHESYRMVRHLTNMLLRAKEIGSYPVPATEPKKSEPPKHIPFEEAVDPGELEAFVAAGAAAGVPRDEAIELLKTEKGYKAR